MKRVHFIGNGYETIIFVIVEAGTNIEAINKAIEIYKKNNWSFKYCEIEVDKC